ncbi:hypothetical protein OIB37_12680 [Streptomyces sp. NBC_00820]|nr:hypothetical protein OIB37_12680 [Streptomyces sp. NBC_00820]
MAQERALEQSEGVSKKRAPIVVHGPSSTGGRRVTARTHGHDEPLGTAFSDHDLIVFLEAAGVTDPDRVVDDPEWVEWAGGPAHEWRLPK